MISISKISKEVECKKYDNGLSCEECGDYHDTCDGNITSSLPMTNKKLVNEGGD